MRKFSAGVFLNIYSSSRREWEDGLVFIQSLKNVEHIELLLEYIPSTHKEVEFFQNLRRDYRLIIHAPFMDLTLLSPHDAIIKASVAQLSKAYEFGRIIGAEAFTIHAGSKPKMWSNEQTLEKIEHAVHALSVDPILPVCIENMGVLTGVQIPIPGTEEEMSMVAQFSSVTLDVGHCIKSAIDPQKVVKKLSKKIYNIHLHDSTPHKDHLALGEGILDTAGLLSTLERESYDKFITLEVVGEDQIRSSWDTLSRYLSS